MSTTTSNAYGMTVGVTAKATTAAEEGDGRDEPSPVATTAAAIATTTSNGGSSRRPQAALTVSFAAGRCFDENDAAAATDGSLVGGKGRNLAVLSRAQEQRRQQQQQQQQQRKQQHDSIHQHHRRPRVDITVPPGFVVTVEAYRRFLNDDDNINNSDNSDISGNDQNRGTSTSTTKRTLRDEIATALARLDDGSRGQRPEPELLDEVSEEILRAFGRRTLSDELERDILRQVSTLFLKTKKKNHENDDDDAAPTVRYVAVRSSATCEDLSEASFAGQHDTYLNVDATDSVRLLERVRDCFASLFSSHAVSYRLQSGGVEHLLSAGMAVIVQAMVVPIDTSGVLFTANPLTGRRTEAVLEVVPGFGEALVSGLTEPDRYVVSKSSDGAVTPAILDTRIGSKRKAIRPLVGGGVVTVEREQRDYDEEGGDDAESVPKPEPVLSDDTVLELVQIGQLVEDLYNRGVDDTGKDVGAGTGTATVADNPQDIEWARSADDGKIYIVQSRPITTLFPLPQLIANNNNDDTKDDQELKVFLSFGAIQGFSEPIYPSGQDAIRNIFGGLIRWASWGRKGTRDRFVRIAAERIYIDATRILRNSVGRKIISKALTAIEPGIKAGVDEIIVSGQRQNQQQRLGIDSGMSPFLLLRIVSLYAIAVPRFIATMMFPDRSREQLFDMMERRVASVEEKAKTVTNLADLVDFKQEVLSTFFPAVVPQIIPRMGSAMGPLLLLKKLASSIPDGNDLVLTVTRGLPHNVTSEMDLKLWEVANAIRGDAESVAAFRSKDADVLAAEYISGDLPKAAQDVVRAFLAVYGMRGLCEIDLGRPRWREEPAPLMQTLKSYVEIDEEHAPDKVFANGEVAAEMAIKRLGEEIGKPWLVSFLARRIRAIAGIRELPKFTGTS